ncbi:MAG: gliding motility-associated C-terminal domain-containing protein [Cytophagales bacterium]|nr:gliding motility-associated C-terminal domain-containing protein [Cytophagales bacterium]MDW8385203.1 gliding motility-associated C-terminal domain-containing protein [Flammeovirgaceae bacterium]
MRIIIVWLLLARCEAFANIFFTENAGQWQEELDFRAEIPNGIFCWWKDSWTITRFLLSRSVEQLDMLSQEPLRGYTFRVVPLKANRHSIKQPQKAFQTTFHYFLGNDSTKWRSFVRNFAHVTQRNLYHKIHLHFFVNQDNQLKYEFEVEKDANPSQILLLYEGVQHMYLHNNHLYIVNEQDTIIELEPMAYQIINNKRTEIPVKFQLKKDTISFVFPKGYSKEHTLVIDPTIVFATYSGSRQNFYGFTVVANKAGQIYKAGVVENSNFLPNLSTLGSFQSFYAGNVDIGIIRYDSEGKNILSATYLGGNQPEAPYCLQINSRGQLVVLGATSSSNFPVTAQAFQRNFGGGRSTVGFAGTFRNGSDITITVLNESLSWLVGSTFFGGSNNELLFDRNNPLMYLIADNDRSEMVLDAQDNIYLVSTTYSFDLPTSAWVVQPSKNVSADVVVASFNPDVSQLRWATFLGGNGTDVGYAIRLFPDQTKLLVAGSTTSANFPTTSDALHRFFRGGASDGFASVLSVDGKNLLHSTLIGTSQYDKVYHADIDFFTKDVVLMGISDTLYPVTFQASFNQQGKVFFHRLDSSLSQTRWTTRIGRSVSSRLPDFTPASVKFAPCNKIHFSGWFASVLGVGSVSMNTLPVTPNALKSTTDSRDFYLGSLSGDGKQLLMATYLGGTSSPFTNAPGDHAHGGTSFYDSAGHLYPAACNCDSQFPISADYSTGLKDTLTLACDALVMKFNFSTVRARLQTNLQKGCVILNLVLSNRGSVGNYFEWIIKNDTFRNMVSPWIYSISQPGEYPIVLIAQNAGDSCAKDYSFDTVQVGHSLADFLSEKSYIRGDSLFCGEQETTFSIPISAKEFQLKWYLSTAKDSVLSTDSVFYWKVKRSDTVFLVVRSDKIFCDSLLYQKPIFYAPDVSADFEIKLIDNCLGELPIAQLKPSQTLSEIPYRLYWGNGDSTDVIPDAFVYPDTGDFLIRLVTNLNNHCQKQAQQTVTIERVLPPNAFSPNFDGVNDTFEIPSRRQGWKLSVLNRWGDLIYSSDNYRSDWKAENVNPGVYFYLLQTPEGQTCKGTITVFK